MALFLPATLARWSGASSLEAVRPWMALVAGLATMTAGLASAVAVSPRRYAHLLLVLALGLGTASASLQASDAPAAAAVATAVAALVLGAALLAAYLALWLADSPSFATAERDRAILRSALETLVPAGGRVASGAADPRIERAILQVYRRSGRWGGVRLRLALRLVDATSLWLARARFERIDAGTRHLVLERLLGASHRLFRRPIAELRAVTLGRFYADPAVQAAIGFDDRYLRTRLQEGPNAIAHAASLAAASALQAESEAAAADASGPSTGDPAAGPTVLAERLQPLRLVRAGPFRP
jgi:hypothetical protein